MKGGLLTLQIWECGAIHCGARHVDYYTTAGGNVLDRRFQVPLPSLPSGWQVVHGGVYCERHVIKTVVDGHESS